MMVLNVDSCIVYHRLILFGERNVGQRERDKEKERLWQETERLNSLRAALRVTYQYRYLKIHKYNILTNL